MCIFCSIASGETPAHRLYEDEKTLAFLEIDPSSPGHTMVIPKKHIVDFMDLDGDLMGSVMETVQKVAGMIGKGLGADNFTIGVNSGKIVGRHVEHVHVHIIPRFPDDGGHYIQGVVKKPMQETLEEITKKITKHGN